MLISVAYIKSNDQFVLRHFPGTMDTQYLDISQLKDQDLQVIFVPNLLGKNELMDVLENEYIYCPVVEADKYFSSIEDFESLSAATINDIFPSLYNNWIVQNNLTLLKQIFSVTTHLKMLWTNDRTAFAEELWFILRSNLGTKKLSIIFNDVKARKKERERNQLIRVNISGTRLPTPITGGEIEAALLKNYENSFNDQFEIVEYIKDEGKMVATVAISKSPLLLIAELYNISPLQQNLITALFEGLQNLPN